MELKIDKKWVDEAVQKAVEELKENNIWIPKGMTNGEVIQALFPNISVYEHGSTYSVNNEYNFNSTWWNAPYKAESGLKGWTSEEMLEQIRKENNDNPEDIGCDHNG